MRSSSLSTHTTRCPRWERHAAVTSPTYPAPTTPTLKLWPIYYLLHTSGCSQRCEHNHYDQADLIRKLHQYIQALENLQRTATPSDHGALGWAGDLYAAGQILHVARDSRKPPREVPV